MDNRKTPDRAEIFAHYGQTDNAPFCSHWPNKPGQLAQLSSLPDFIRLAGLDQRRFRIIFDYDPEYSNMLLTVTVTPSNPGP